MSDLESEIEIETPIDRLLSQIEEIKQDITDSKYMKMVETLMEVKKDVVEASRLDTNRLLVVEMFQIVSKAIMNLDLDGIPRTQPKLRPFEAVNVMVCFLNILENLQRMTEEESTEQWAERSKLTFIVEQLQNNYANETYQGITSYRSPIQTLDYGQLARVMTLLSSLKF